MFERNPREIDVGSSYREVRVSEGSSYRDSTVVDSYESLRCFYDSYQVDSIGHDWVLTADTSMSTSERV